MAQGNGVPEGPKLPEGSIPLVAIVKMPDGKQATVWFIQPKAALRLLTGAADDLRDQIYTEREPSHIVAPPTPALVKP